MATIARLAAALGFFSALSANQAAAGIPIRAHPQNPYIFEFEGHPTVLRTYAESYASVANSNMPFIPYLDVLKRDGMNLTRVWLVGHPLEPPAIPAHFLQPWQRNPASGNAMDGLGKWDFSTWDENFFIRLKDFAQAASDRGIVVEFTLFSVQYDEEEWEVGPFHPSNNVQGYGSLNRYDCYRQNSANLTLMSAQQAAVRRIVRELNAFDNVYYEIQNEPFWNEPEVMDPEEAAFHNSMLEAIRNEELGLPKRHLVAHNYPQQLANLSNDFDIINEHYPAEVPSSTIAGAEALLRDHYSRGRILGLDESDTTTALQTRLEPWMFLIGGGGIYDAKDAQHLVYTLEDPSGDNALGSAMRGAVRNGGTYMDRLHLVALRRNLSWVTGGIPTGATLQASASPGQQYVAYLHHGKKSLVPFQLCYDPIDTSNHNVSLTVTLEAGTWRAAWTRPVDLVELHTQEFTHAGGPITLAQVTYQADVALRIDRTGAEDTTPPPHPTGLEASSNAEGLITLSWDPVQSFDLAGYHVYRSETPGVPIDTGHRIAVLQAADLDFQDTSVVDKTTYHYVVTAVDQTGNESPASSETSATSILIYPQLYVYGNDQGQFLLEWTTTLPGWYLQESPDLTPGSWTYYPAAPIIVGDHYQVTITPTSQRRFFRLIHQAPPPPQLRVHDGGNGLFVLKWSTISAGWNLQESADLAPDSWIISTLTPIIVGDQYQVTITPTLQRRFFRLIHP